MLVELRGKQKMRKLRRSVEQNKRKNARAKRVLMALLTATVALSDAGAISAYAEVIPNELPTAEDEDGDSSPLDGSGENNDNEGGEGGTEGSNGEGGTEGSNGEDGTEGVNGEDGTEGVNGEGGTEGVNGEGDADSEDGEDGEDDADGEDDEDDEDAEDDENGNDGTESDKEGVGEIGLLGSRMMMASSQSSSDTSIKISPKDGNTIDLNKVEIESGRINVVIENSGSYTLKGSNERGEAYVDVSIIIEQGVVADLYFDNFHIVNDDFDYTETTSIFSADKLIVNPIVVNGTANVHVQSDSEIKAVTDFFKVSGTLNFVDSVENAKLNCSLSKVMRTPIEPGSEDYYWLSNALIISKSGEVHFKDANVHFENSDMEGLSYSRLDLTDQYASPKVYLDGTKVSFGENIKISKMYTSLSDLSGCDFNVDELYNSEGLRVYSKVVGGFPAGSQILQIENFDGDKVLGMTRPADLYADDSGKIPASLVTNQMLFFVKTGDGVKVYDYYNNDGSGTRGANASSFYQPRLVTIKFVDSSGNEIESYYSLKAVQDSDGEYSSTHSLFFPEEDSQYVYTYKLGDGTPVTRDTMITGDMVIYVTTVEKGKIQVTIDDTDYLVDYGTLLSSVGDSSTQYYLNTESNKLVKGEEPITEEGSFKSINITTTTDSLGKEWFELSNEADLEEFAYIVNSGNGKINGRLNGDIHALPSDFSMIGTVTEGALYSDEEKINDINNHSFSGTFDGQNHTVNIDNLENKNRVNYGFATGLFGCVSAGAIIQNIILTGSVSGGKYTGALAGTTFGQSGNITIKNCINHATVTGHGENACVGGLIGGNISSMFCQSDMTVEIDYCGNTGEVKGLNGSGFVGGLIGDSSNVSVFSSFNSHDSNLLGRPYNCTISGSFSRMGSEDVVKTKEAFKSGEVAYLLNRAAGFNKWFQKCGIDNSPSLSGDVVYAGYADCDDTELSYSNTEFTHTIQGHKDKGTYTYSNGRIVAKCLYCDDEISADINCGIEELSDRMKGVTVAYSDDWTSIKCPDIVIKYSEEEDGTYSDVIPQSVGEYYLKAYIGNSAYEVDITDTYTVKAKPAPVYNDDSDNSSEGSNEYSDDNGVTGNSEEDNYIDNLVDDINEYVNQMSSIGNNTENRAVNSRELKIFEYKGTSIPNNVIEALRNGLNIALKYESMFMGKKYEFIITSEDAKFFNESITWYGPLYLNMYFILKRLNMLSLFKLMGL